MIKGAKAISVGEEPSSFTAKEQSCPTS